MLRMHPAFGFERVGPNQVSTVILALALIACSLLWDGCSGISQSSAASTSSSAQQISLQTPVLPGSSVGSSYHQVLSVSGGQAPYNFVVNAGKLPPGLVLNALSGSISGIPTQAGAFPFGITVTAEPSGASGTHGYSIMISPPASSVKVQISPAETSVAAGGNVQFSAGVSNTSNTAVTWSASAGSISANGLFTAPVASSVNSITINAISVADPTVRAIATATVTSSAFTISTTSMPSAKRTAAYSASLSASGGQPPYRWSIVTGALPSGLQLNTSTGLLSGSATKGGTFSFTVQGTDAASHTARRSYSLLVSTSGRICGPPAYDCSRTDFNTAQIPTQIPNVGHLTGANTIVTDPDFGNRIVRITDWNTDPGAPAENRSYISAASGSADENLWNVDSTMFILQTLGDAGYPYTFDSSTLQAARMYVSSYPSKGGLKLSDGVWSRVDPNVLYTADRTSTAINKYDFSDRTNPPSPQVVYDFTSSRNCLPSGFTVTWKSKGGVSAGDAVFGMAYSNTGAQGTGVYAVAYKAGSGCTTVNTRTGQVWGDWGAKGTINIADRWLIHNVKLSKDGNWLIIATAGCLMSHCSQGPYFWQIGTTNVSSCGDGKTSGQRCGGHWTEGYSHWVNNYDAGKLVSRPLSEPTAFGELTTVPSGIADPLDQHASWNNVDPADSLPFFLTFWSLTSPFPGPWYNEITGVAPDGTGKVWRFAHNFITGRSQIFSTQYGIGSVSQDGRFFIFSSDWMGTLGSQSAASTCTIGTDCRGDVFVVELN